MKKIYEERKNFNNLLFKGKKKFLKIENFNDIMKEDYNYEKENIDDCRAFENYKKRSYVKDINFDEVYNEAKVENEELFNLFIKSIKGKKT